MDSIVKYGQETGKNLIKLAKKLMQNQNLLKLLVNTDLDPLNEEKHPNNIDGISLLHKNIRVIPLLTAEEQTTQSKIVLLFDEGKLAIIIPIMKIFHLSLIYIVHLKNGLLLEIHYVHLQ